ncbi:MAG TPA: hypothetical protein VFQ44_04745 [Streptosporangiaceae bacterium]|nr:hypothetical protein [Streptosporangiaceae bacterium]
MRALLYVAGFVTAVSVAACLAGCGTQVEVTGRHSGTHHPAMPVTPASQLRAQAKAVARAFDSRLLALAPVPPGARQVRPAACPPALKAAEHIGLPGRTIDLARFYRVPLRMASLRKFLRAHVPPGSVSSDSGSDRPVGAAEPFVAYTMKSGPDGVAGGQLVDSMRPAPGGGTCLRIDAQAIWALPRSAAEHVDPAEYRAVEVTMHRTLPNAGTVTKAFTARPVIAEFARRLNAMPTASGLPMPCPFFASVFRLVFEPKSPSGERIAVAAAPCESVDVKVGGSPQPALTDSTGLASLVIRLAGLGQNRPGHQPG